jgi:hypothetical protein
MSITTQTFDGDQFHDSSLLSIDFSQWLQKVSMTFWCPHAGESWEMGRYLRLHFKNILFFGYEAAFLGEFSAEYLRVYNVVLAKRTQDLEEWQAKLDDLAQPALGYPSGIRSLKYSDLYHFLFDTEKFSGSIFLRGKPGWNILCRDFELQDVTTDMPPNAPKYQAIRIESE